MEEVMKKKRKGSKKEKIGESFRAGCPIGMGI